MELNFYLGPRGRFFKRTDLRLGQVGLTKLGSFKGAKIFSASFKQPNLVLFGLSATSPKIDLLKTGLCGQYYNSVTIAAMIVISIS